MHSHLDRQIRSRRHLHHVALKHQSLSLRRLIYLAAYDLRLVFIAWGVLYYVLISAVEARLSGSESVYPESSHHNGSIGAPGDCVPGGLGVAPAAGGDHFEPEEGVHVALALQAEQLVSVDHVLLVQHVRIAQFLLPVVQVDKVRSHLRHLTQILQQLLHRALYLH